MGLLHHMRKTEEHIFLGYVVRLEGCGIIAHRELSS